SLIFMDASGSPRVPIPISASSQGDMTCTSISTAGSVILVGTPSNNQAVTQPVFTTSTTTSNPVVTTTNATGNIVHTVQAGENLYRIGLRYNVPFTQIALANNIGSDYRIFVGQQLIIPSS
ncbi:MAG: LysM domain-containing protein, partial [Chloroflexota bacterium]